MTYVRMSLFNIYANLNDLFMIAEVTGWVLIAIEEAKSVSDIIQQVKF